MGKKNRRKNEKALQQEGVLISEEDHQRYIAFCSLKEKFFETIEELDEAWQEHCRLLYIDLQIDLETIDSTVDNLITKLVDLLRNVKYTKKDKKKKNKFQIPLSGGIGKSYDRKKVVEAVVIQPKKNKKALISFELISNSKEEPIFFSVFYPINLEEMKKEKCKHENYIPCIVCNYEDITIEDLVCAKHGNVNPCMVCEGILDLV